ncbi:major capsid protein [Sigmofec virus UA08Rod_6079]|uniref:Major capsid protein n=1 Tax=Sigmofec virus UA08Rod_6079 TaxID=2929450 RepID=A0A976N0U1_9VIRU|nr:major capsid protein [Sigmofec virus UA08Rod_6079]
MSYLPRVVIEKPKRSNVDLSFVNRFSAGPGMLIPVMVKEVFAGDNISCNLNSLIFTPPTKGLLFGSFKVQFDYFFAPFRLYNKVLHDDRVTFDPSSVYFPVMQFSQLKSHTGDDYISNGCHPTSLGHYLGIPEFFSREEADAVVTRRFNAVPFFAYFDIFRGYYANVQEDTAPQVSQVLTTGEPVLLSYSLSSIDTMKANLFSKDSGSPYVLPVDGKQGFYETEKFHYPCGGLMCRTFLPDRFSAWMSNSNYAAVLSRSVVDVSSGSFNMDSFRFARHLNNMLLKTEIAGGRYSNWQKVQFGTSVAPLHEVPLFLGSVSGELNFTDVVQTAPGADGSAVGSLGGRGVGGVKNRSLKFYIEEYGYLMCIVSLIPRVDYYQGVKSFYNHKTLSNIHVPAMDGIGFQDLLADEFCAQASELQGGYPVAQAIGKQPAWTECMTAVNELHGTFAMPDNTMFMTLARRYEINPQTQLVKNSSAYINPVQFNYIFADASLDAQNFWFQCRFDVYVKRVISKKLMPTL